MTRARDVANVLSTATALATDTETAAAISSHNSVTTSVHGIADTSVLATQTYANNAASAIIPSQTNNSGKYLTTNGTAVSWGTVTAGSDDFLLMGA